MTMTIFTTMLGGAIGAAIIGIAVVSYILIHGEI